MSDVHHDPSADAGGGVPPDDPYEVPSDSSLSSEPECRHRFQKQEKHTLQEKFYKA